MFPETEKLLTLERKYGDSLNVEDMTGKAKVKKKKAAAGGAEQSATQDNRSLETGTVMQSDGDPRKTGQAFSTGGASQEDLKSQARIGVGTPDGSQASVHLTRTKEGTAGATTEPEIAAAAEAPKDTKRKADTDARNDDFEMLLRARAGGEVPDFLDTNRRHVRNQSTGRPLKPRLDIPEGMEVYAYGGQKLNIWEQ